MNKTLVLLTLALALGIAAAPTAAASCPPTWPPRCEIPPVGQGVGCAIDNVGIYVGQIFTDCL